MSGVIAIVGRPNVGKSALFNRIAGRRIAIVHDQPGVTRDRVTAEVEWDGRPFTIIDTGGIGLLRREKVVDVIQSAMLQQVELAIEAAHVILFVVNVQEGVVPLDEEVARKLRDTQKPVFVVVNKVDNFGAQAGVPEFSSLGFERIYGVTAIHGEGAEQLMDEAVKLLPPWTAPAPLVVPEEEETKPAPGSPAGKARAAADSLQNRAVRLAIVGRPNVGKSSIINALTGSERVIVSPIPGTTRDAVDVPFEVETDGVRQSYVLVDTAGVRKARRIDDSVEYFSVERTKNAIARSDIAVLVIDAEAGITEQDKKIADVIVEARRSCIVVINKWDLMTEVVRKAREAEMVEREEKTRDRDDRRKRLTTLSEFGEWVQKRLFFLSYAPVIFTSAKDGFQLERLLEAVRYVAAQLRQAVPTGILNRTLQDAIERRQPVSVAGHRLRFYYATQVKQAPPIFKLFVNRDELFSTQYEKYLADELRKAFGYEGCPIVIVAVPRPKTIDPVRKFKRRPFSDDRAERHGRERGTKPGGGPGPTRLRDGESGDPTRAGGLQAARPTGRPPKGEAKPEFDVSPFEKTGGKSGGRLAARPGTRAEGPPTPRSGGRGLVGGRGPGRRSGRPEVTSAAPRPTFGKSVPGKPEGRTEGRAGGRPPGKFGGRSPAKLGGRSGGKAANRSGGRPGGKTSSRPGGIPGAKRGAKAARKK
jgi:GTP-binding protein